MSRSYAFRAVDNLGAKVNGEVEADSTDGVAALLRGRGLLALEVKLKGSKALDLSLDRFARVKLEDLALLTRQLSTMISSGLSLMRALVVLDSQTENPRLKAAIVVVRQDIENGASLSSALERHPKIFSPLYVAMIHAGETGGFLESTLMRVADQLESQNRLKRQVHGAMVYPAVVMGIAGVVIVAMLVFIIPVFAGVFKSFGGKMPTLTQDTIAVSNVVSRQWYLVLIGVVLTVVGFRRWKTSKSGRPVWDRARLKAPLKIGSIVQKIALARWARTLSSLTTAGVPMLEAIDVTGQTAGNAVVERAMASVRDSVQGGGTIAAALEREPIFPTLVTSMVRVGEETGALDSTLAKVAEFYEDQVDAAVKSLTSVLEPIMIAVVGVVVGFMIMAMYLPMFHVYDSIK
jgi:type IV pilus assembly protein PilC